MPRHNIAVFRPYPFKNGQKLLIVAWDGKRRGRPTRSRRPSRSLGISATISRGRGRAVERAIGRSLLEPFLPT